MKLSGQSKSRNYCVGLVLFVACMINQSIAHASDVLVTVEDTRGQGILQKRGSECLIVTPKHVVEDADSFDVLVQYSDRNEVSAEVVERFSEDVAVLRADNSTGSYCDNRPFQDAEIANLLSNNQRGTLRKLGSDGSTGFVQVDIVGFDSYKTIRIKPSDSNTPIKQGFSGSRLYIDGQLVGMLTNVNAQSGMGLVMQSSFLNSVIDPFFNAANSGNVVKLDFDKRSQFLEPIIVSAASSRNFKIDNVSDGWNYKLTVSTETEEIVTNTDKLVKYITSINVVDQFQQTVFSESVTSTGNSFVSKANADKNARKIANESISNLNIFNSIK